MAESALLLPPIEWSPALSVGIDEIDGQHRVLIELANRLQQVVAEQRGRRQALALLEQLVEYTRIHFAIEEALMRVHGFPDYEQHRRGHDRLIDQIYSLRHRAVEDAHGFDAQLSNDIQRWVFGHIREADPDYTAFFVERGLKTRYDNPSWCEALWGG